MKPIVLYLRVSTTDQNLDSQLDDLIHYAKQNNLKVDKVFGEKVSGYDLTVERKEYDSMKKYVLINNIKDILVWEISRLSRSMVTTVNELDFFTKNGINVHFKKENLNSLSNDVTNQLLLTILSSMAQMERDTLMERMSRGRITAVNKGRMVGYGIPPYGFTSDEKGIIAIEPEEAKVIKTIFEMSSEGKSLYSICLHLNSLNISTRMKLHGKQRTFKNGTKKDYIWQPTTISRMLRRTIYKGERNYKGNIINIPAIVDDKLWNKVQNRIKNNVGYHNKTKYDYLFKSKIKCGKCGRLLVTLFLKRHNYSYYRCGSASELEKCTDSRYVSSNLIDEVLYKALFDHKYISELMTLEAPSVIEKDNKIKVIEYINTEIEGLRQKEKRIKKLYINGHIEIDEYEKENAMLKNQIIAFENKINVAKSEIETLSKIDIKDIIKTYKDTTDFNMKRNFIIKYVSDINLYYIDVANVNWDKPINGNDNLFYIETRIFNYSVPIKILLSTYTKNVIVSNDLSYLPDYNMVVDVSINKLVK